MYLVGAVLAVVAIGAGSLMFLNSMGPARPGLLRRLTLPRKAQLGPLSIAGGPGFVVEVEGQRAWVRRLRPAVQTDELTDFLRFSVGATPNDSSKWVQQERACVPSKPHCRVRITPAGAMAIHCYERAVGHQLRDATGVVGGCRIPGQPVTAVYSCVARHCDEYYQMAVGSLSRYSPPR